MADEHEYETEHTKNLTAARERLVEERRDLAVALNNPYTRGHTENLQDRFNVIQATIEAIDRAIGDEKHIAGRPHAQFQGS
jgi:hypothetical protein